MTADAMVRVGRGGAGNYYSTPVNEKNAPSKSQVAGATQPASAPALTGRGGAGNIVSGPNAAAHAEGKERPSSIEVGAATDAAANNHHGMLAGRGGAGNWRGDTGSTREDAQAAAQDAEARKRAVVAHVDFELRRPEPTHTRVRHSERRLNR